MNNILEIKHLTKYYGNVLGVKDLNLNIKKGEIFGFIGPNGAGKSTTIRSIMNLINKTEGEILFNGILLDKNNIALKKEIGYLPSEIYLYDDLTVKEILDLRDEIIPLGLIHVGYPDCDLEERTQYDEENIHVGQLQSLLNSLDVSSLNIETGKQEGQEQIDLATNTTNEVVTEDLDSETPMPPEFATYKGDNVDTSQHCIRFNTYDDMVKFIESFGYEISAEDKKAHNNNWFYANKDGKKYFVTFGIYKYPEEKRAM